MLHNRWIHASFAVLLAVGGCEREGRAPAGAERSVFAGAGTAALSNSAIDYAAVAAAAVAHPGRPEADRAEDERRKAAMALSFFQVGPGMTIFEIEAGSGWYTELLSHAAGPDGVVIMQNPEWFRAFVSEQIDARLAGNRLANVRQSVSSFDALGAGPESVDVATWVQGPHELYFMPRDGARLGDPARSYAEIFRILKPDGVFAVIDHSALAGSPYSTGNELHRLDRAVVVEMAEAAGFKLELESDFLANPDDPRTITVFDPAVRGQTDQFALRFRKPR